MWQVRPGVFPELWSELNAQSAAVAKRQRKPNGGRFYGSDQAWMSYRLPDRPTWGADDGVMMYTSHIVKRKFPLDQAKIVFFAGSIKPWRSQLKEEYAQWLS
jgi:hypothetical protein